MNRFVTSVCTGALFATATLFCGSTTGIASAQENAIVQNASTDPDAALRRGDIDAAVVGFDRAVETSPARMPYLWQRGIALYFAGRLDDAAEQFRQHRVVNPNDVENAAWHFLCVAKSKSPEIAKEMLLPAPGDRREPMDEVLDMLATGNKAGVQERMDEVAKLAPGSRAAEDAKFYGEFYLGLYADANGDFAGAKRHMNSAAEDAPPHYMGDVARVYARQLAGVGQPAEQVEP